MLEVAYLIALVLFIALLIFYRIESPMWFTLTFIAWASVAVYSIANDFIPAVLTIIGLIFANHSVQPLFYPIAVKSQNKDRYITSHHRKHSFPPFRIEGLKEGDDPEKEEPKFDYYLHNYESFTIKLPIIPVFKTIKVDYPATQEVSIDTGDITRYSVLPFIDVPMAEGNSIKLKIRASAWTITEAEYPIHFSQKLEEGPNAGIGGVTYYYPYSKEEFASFPEYKPINKEDEYGVLVSFYNYASAPLRYYEGVGRVIIDKDIWSNFGKAHIQVSFENDDIVGVYKGHIYFRISDELKPFQRRNYYISSREEGRIVTFSWQEK